MRNKHKYSPEYIYMIDEPSIRIDDDILMSLEFEPVVLEYNENQIDYKAMQESTAIEVKVFNELFLDREIEFIDSLEMDVSYPIYI